MKIPKAALSLRDPGAATSVLFESLGETERQPKLDMTVYSGKIISDHWWWDNLALDLSGVVFDTDKFPILGEHSVDRRIAFSNGKPIVNGSIRFDPDKIVFLDTEYAESFLKDAAKGFPYQASAGTRPLSVERVNPGASVEVNGMALKGPGTVFRKWLFKEGSICVFGADRKSKTSTFNEDEMAALDCEITGDHGFFNGSQIKTGTKGVDKKELKEKHADLVEALRNEVKIEVSAVVDGLRADIAAFKEENTTLSADNKDLAKQVVSLEAAGKARDLKDAESKAESIFAEKITSSKVPEKMHARVQRGVAFNDFFKDGAFDAAAFAAAVDAEIKDWETDLGDVASVQGLGASGRGVDCGNEEKAENDLVDSMLNIAGQFS